MTRKFSQMIEEDLVASHKVHGFIDDFILTAKLYKNR